MSATGPETRRSSCPYVCRYRSLLGNFVQTRRLRLFYTSATASCVLRFYFSNDSDPAFIHPRLYPYPTIIGGVDVEKARPMRRLLRLLLLLEVGESCVAALDAEQILLVSGGWT